jgi:hypothetical protein
MSTSIHAGQSETLRLVVRTLYALTTAAGGLAAPGSVKAASIAGHKFEDAAAKAAYEALVRVGVSPHRPRHVLRVPTVSGLYQQFDVVVCTGLRYFIVELKRRSSSEIEQLYAFVAKLLDYALAARLQGTGHTFTGIFVSTAPRMNDNFRQFAIAYGVIPVGPDLPPCHVLEATKDSEAVCQDAADLAARLHRPLPNVVVSSAARLEALPLLREWQSIALRRPRKGQDD